MTTKRTKGPWRAEFPDEISVRDADGGRIAILANLKGRLGMQGRRYTSEVEANARLIAAAPDLLEALREIMPFTATAAVGCHGDKCREPWCYSCNGEQEAEEAAQKGCDAYAKALAAIAKATGEQQ